MNIIEVPGTNMNLAEAQDEYLTLPVRACYVSVSCHDGQVEDVPAMISGWKPSREELALLLDGAYVELCVLGTSHPPVMLNVTPHDSKVPANANTV